MQYKIFILFVLVSIANFSFAQSDRIIVPIAGNSYQLGKSKSSEDVKVYVRFAKTGKVNLILTSAGKVDEELKLNVKINNQQKIASIAKGEDQSAMLKDWRISDTGYVAIEIKYLKGVNKQKVKDLILSGTAVDEKISFVKNNEGNFFYWGRRGPSVHLNYQLPANTAAEWFYNEVTVAEGNDVIGSYFMVNGFAEGYFGMQVNSPTERRILFSVWSPFTTDDPKSIPESHKIKMVQKGDDVYTGEFGNEGAGGQSYLKYNWKAGSTYKFLLHVVPNVILPKPKEDGTVDLNFVNDGTTIYTAYFFAPEINRWKLIASFIRPKTVTYLKRPHSFLENFIPEMGDQTRKVAFNNQWVIDTNSNWIEIDKATFTIDNTGRLNYRKDYSGGIEKGEFFLKNCGFFNHYTPSKTIFTKVKSNQRPSSLVDFFNNRRWPQN